MGHNYAGHRAGQADTTFARHCQLVTGPRYVLRSAVRYAVFAKATERVAPWDTRSLAAANTTKQFGAPCNCRHGANSGPSSASVRKCTDALNPASRSAAGAKECISRGYNYKIHLITPITGYLRFFLELRAKMENEATAPDI